MPSWKPGDPGPMPGWYRPAKGLGWGGPAKGPGYGGPAAGDGWGGPARGAGAGDAVGFGRAGPQVGDFDHVRGNTKEARASSFVMDEDRRRYLGLTPSEMAIFIGARLLEIAGNDSHPRQLDAAMALDDRLNGKPRQSTEITGAGGAPLGPMIYLPDNGRD